MVGVLGEKERYILLRCQFPDGIGFGPGICGAVEGDASCKWEGKGLCKRCKQDAFYSQIVSGSIGRGDDCTDAFGNKQNAARLTKFQELAKEAKAVYKIDKVALVNCEIFEKYLETFRIA